MIGYEEVVWTQARLRCARRLPRQHPHGRKQSSPKRELDSFHIMISNSDEHEMLADLVFPTSAGWVFGDRDGYRCAYLYFSEGGMNVAKVTFERVGDYAAMINDRFGVEPNLGMCGTADTPTAFGTTAPPFVINATTFALGGLCPTSRRGPRAVALVVHLTTFSSTTTNRG